MRIIPAILTFALAGSVAFNVWQFKQTSDQHLAMQQQAEDIQRITSDRDAITAQSEEIQSLLDESLLTIEQQTAELTAAQEDYRKLQASSAKAVSTVNGLKCREQISGDALEKITTNQGLIELITEATEKTYRVASVNTTFDLIWDNSKSAIFHIVTVNKTVARSVVTWDQNSVTSIYDISLACFYFNQ